MNTVKPVRTPEENRALSIEYVDLRRQRAEASLRIRQIDLMLAIERSEDLNDPRRIVFLDDIRADIEKFEYLVQSATRFRATLNSSTDDFATTSLEDLR